MTSLQVCHENNWSREPWTRFASLGRLGSFANLFGEELGGLVADDMITGEIRMSVAEPARLVSEMGIEPIVHHDDRVPLNERLDPLAVLLRNLVERSGGS